MTSQFKASVALVALVAQPAALAGPAAAFCGFYVAKADSKLFNKSSRVAQRRKKSTAPESSSAWMTPHPVSGLKILI
jgi:hypothetical protein